MEVEDKLMKYLNLSKKDRERKRQAEIKATETIESKKKRLATKCLINCKRRDESRKNLYVQRKRPLLEVLIGFLSFLLNNIDVVYFIVFELVYVYIC